MLTDIQTTILRAVIDRIVPADTHPSGTGFGADRYVVAQLGDALSDDAPAIAVGLDALDAGFVALPAEAQDDALRAIESAPWFVRLVELTQEGVYADPDNGGNADMAAWRMVGYAPRLPDGVMDPPPQLPPPPRAVGSEGVLDYDVIIVGAGAGGGVMACVLAEGGKSVLLLERGRELSYAHDGHHDHLRNHRLAAYGHNTGPALDGHPRVFVDADGHKHVVPPHHALYHNNAAGVGSGTFVYGAQAWRFHPDDFRMASRYGVPEGSSLADWPIGYDELAPFYDWAEWELGVSGEPADGFGPRSRGYPMPPVPQYRRADVLRAGADALGIATFAPPYLINTQPYARRAACVECGQCVGFACPVDAKNGTQNTMIPRALASGRTTLVTGATVEMIETDGSGTATGVRYWSEAADGAPTLKTARAKAVVVSAGAIESARLLLLSGAGDKLVHLGRHLQGHYYPSIFGRFAEEINTSRGPGVTLATIAHVHGNPGIVGGAMLADDFVMTPMIFHKQALPPAMRRWGQKAKDFMRHGYLRVSKLTGPVHEIPSPDCSVTLAGVEDRHGIPVAQLAGQIHEETVRSAEYVIDRGLEWLTASGAEETWSLPVRRRLSAGQHQAGTCRMGTDPASSVTDSHGRVWGYDNLFVSDASLHPTNGAFNPVLTIMAMAARNGQHVLQSI